MSLLFRKKNLFGVWIRNQDGFKLLEGEKSKGSINDISIHLGYNPYHIHTYHGNFNKKSNIEIIAFEVFTKNIVFILVRNYKVRITQRHINRFLKKFEFKQEYDSVFVRDYLLEGIADKSLNIEFLSKVLEFQNENHNGEYYIKMLGVNLFFINGILASFKIDNDLEEWARHFQEVNKDLIANYARTAKKYWKDDYEMIYLEVNKQSEALANTPSGFLNEFIKLHRDEFNTVNFLMLLVCHYDLKINEKQFVHFNHGRFQRLVLEKANIKIYHLRKYAYYFDEKGQLNQTIKIK